MKKLVKTEVKIHNLSLGTYHGRTGHHLSYACIRNELWFCMMYASRTIIKYLLMMVPQKGDVAKRVLKKKKNLMEKVRKKKEHWLNVDLITMFNKSLHSNKATEMINIYLILWRKIILEHIFKFLYKKMFYDKLIMIFRFGVALNFSSPTSNCETSVHYVITLCQFL